MKPTLILFDLDGTLVYSNRVDSQCFADTYETIYQRRFPGIDWHHYPHVTDHTIFQTVIADQFGRAVEAAEIHNFQEAFVQRLQALRKDTPEEFQEVPAARITVEKLLQEKRFIVGIATGGWHRPALVKLSHVGIPADALIMSCADNKVSREEILGEAIEQARASYGELERIVYVGDALWDVVTTRNMAINFIGVRREGDVEVLKQAGAKEVIRDFSDYEQFVELIDCAQPPLATGNQENERF